MALDSYKIKEKKEQEEIKKQLEEKLLREKSNINLHELIDSLPTLDDNELDQKIVKEEEKKEFSFVSNNQNINPKNEDDKYLDELISKLSEDVSPQITTFYHGGVESDFTIDQLDLLRPSQKQQNKNGSYAGFYMYGEENYKDAIHYAEQENSIKNTTSKGVVKITMKGELKKYEIPSFSINRITQEQIMNLQQQGYDLIYGKVPGVNGSKTEYVLLNKEKINSIEFIPLQKKLEEIQGEEVDGLKETKSELNIDENLEKRNNLINNIKNKYDSINNGLNNIYNSSQLSEQVQVMKNSLNQINNIENMSVEDLKQIDLVLNNLIHEFSILSQKADELKESDNFKIQQQERKQNELNMFTISLQNNYGSNWIAKMTTEEKNQFINLYSSIHNISHEQVEKSIEDSIEKLYTEKVNQIKNDSNQKEEIKKQQIINQQYQITLQQLVELRKQAIQLFNNNIHDETLNRLLHSFVSVYNIKESQNITSKQLDKLYEVYSQFDTAIEDRQKQQTANEIKQTQTIQEILASERNPIIEQQREQISELIEAFRDYRSQQKINTELLKAEERFEQLKQSSSGDVVVEQQKLIDWLTNAKITMLSRLQEKQEELKQQETMEQQKNEIQYEQHKPNEYKQMIDELVETRKVEQEQALATFNATRQQAQTELINKRMAEIYKILGKGNVYQQIEDEMNYGGFSR